MIVKDQKIDISNEIEKMLPSVTDNKFEIADRKINAVVSDGLAIVKLGHEESDKFVIDACIYVYALMLSKYVQGNVRYSNLEVSEIIKHIKVNYF